MLCCLMCPVAHWQQHCHFSSSSSCSDCCCTGWPSQPPQLISAPVCLPPSLPHFALKCRYLDPVTLARSACVCREWQATAADDGLWRRHCARMPQCRQPCGAAMAMLPEQPSGGSSAGNDDCSGICGSYRQQFAAAARRHPASLLPWRTNRVLLGSRLAWLPVGQQLRGRCRHLDTAAVLSFLQSGGRRRRGMAHGRGSGGSSGSSNGDGGGGDAEAAGLSGKLRFWQL